MLAAAEKKLKLFAAGSALFVFIVCYVSGEHSQSGSQRGLVGRLETTGRRHGDCIKSLKMMKGEVRSQVETEIQLAEDEQESLKQENNLFTEDNNALREENYLLEEQIDSLRDELNEQDFIVDTEVEPLAELTDLGNNTQALRELLEEAEMDGQVSKDTLLTRLISEITYKRDASKGCRERLEIVAHSLTELSGRDHKDLVSDIFGEWDEYLRFKGHKDRISIGGSKVGRGREKEAVGEGEAGEVADKGGDFTELDAELEN